MPPRFRPPLWFELLLALAGAAFVSWAAAHWPPPPHAPGALPTPDAAFLGFIALLAELVWKGLEVAGRVSLAILQYAVSVLWAFARVLHDGLIELGGDVMAGLRRAWQFLRVVYDDVLKPAWLKFWQLVDQLKRWLDKFFAPVFKVLRAVRDDLLKFYAKVVQPVLDSLEIGRSIVRIFGSLGFEWAKKLDQWLGDLESRIDGAFRLVLRKVNEVVNIVNRVVTLDGLLQRLALVRSIARDFQVIGDEWARLHKPAATDAELAAARKQRFDMVDAWTYGEDLGKAYEGDDGAYTGIVSELSAEWKVAAGLKR